MLTVHGLLMSLVGYDIFSKWVASDQGWLIVRHFGTLNTRVILALQDQIVQLEEELKAVDDRCRLPSSILHDDDQTDNGSFRKDFSERKELICDKLVNALSKYSRLMLMYNS